MPDDARPDIAEAYVKQRAKFVAEVEKQEKGAPKFRPSTAHRARKMRLPKSVDAPMKEREAFAPGDWVEWTPYGGTLVQGSVWSNGPGYANWWVVTDRSGVTGECHLMERDRLGGFKINGAEVRSLRGAVPEQLPFEEVPQVPGARIPAPPKLYDLWERKGFEKASRPVSVEVSGDQMAIFGTVRYYPHRIIAVDGLEFVVKLHWHERTKAPVFEPRVFNGEQPIATLGRMESLAEAVRRCERYARVVDAEAAKRVYSERSRKYFSPEYIHSGKCPKCQDENPLYEIPDFDTLSGGPLCAACLGFRVRASAEKISTAGRAKRVAATRRPSFERMQGIAAWEKRQREERRELRRYRLEFPLDVVLPSADDSRVWGAQTPLGGDKEHGWNWPCRDESYRVEVAGFKYAVKWDGTECVGVGYWQDIKNIVRSHRHALEEERRERVLARLAGEGAEKAPVRPVEAPKRLLWAPGDRVSLNGRQGRVRSVEMGGSPVRVAWEGETTTSAVPAGELERAEETQPQPEEERAPERQEKEQETPVKTAKPVQEKTAKSKGAPKVGDIEFSGDRGRERAEILGHRYLITMLAGTYGVEHIASGDKLCDYEPKRPAMKRAILADAIARGAAAPELADPVTEFAKKIAEAQPERVPLTYADLEGKSLGDFTAPEDVADLERLAGVWPVRWLFEGKRRAVNQFGGCGGWCVGIREILGADLDMVCIDHNADAVATSNAAGCNAIQADITTLDPSHPALRWTEFLISSPPCTDWTPAGKRLGHLPENLAILEEAINRAAWAAGNYEWGETGEDDEDHPDWDPEFPPHYGPPSGESWDEVRAVADAMSAPTAKLMLEPVIWALALWRAGAPLHTVALEQSGALPEDVQEALSSELYSAGWECVDWADVDAADFGSPSHRRRKLMLASRYYHRRMPEAPGLTTTAAEATGLASETVIITRGNRKTSGGNGFSLGRTVPGITSKIRGWYKQDDPEFRFTLGQIAKLVTLPADHPLTGSRTSAAQQAADIVAPVVSAAVMGTLLGVPWLPSLEGYLARHYPDVHGTPEPARGPGQLHVWDDDGGAIPGVEPPQPQKSLLQQFREEIAEADATRTAPPFRETLERYCGADWKPLEATADPLFEDDGQEDDEPQGAAPLTREQRAAAWRIVAGEERPEPQEPEESDEARRVREFVERLRAADVVHQEQEAARDWFEPSAMPEAPAVPEPEDNKQEHQEEPQRDPFEELRRELVELRADVETWGAEVAALAVAEAERVVAEVADDLRAAELLEMRREAAAVRELLAWELPESTLEEVEETGARRARWRTAWASTAAWAVGTAVLFAEGWAEGWEEAMRQ
ncbi:MULTISPECIES: hypothetical protein [Streptomyces]|uniref:hypothetical protein n=1 Tax=Streptomyces TaxID=1883 RepID=UPI00345B7D1F